MARCKTFTDYPLTYLQVRSEYILFIIALNFRIRAPAKIAYLELRVFLGKIMSALII